MARHVALTILALLVSASTAHAEGLLSRKSRPGEQVLSSRVPLIRDLAALASGRAMSPEAIRRVARFGPAFPTREQMVERLTRERHDARRAVFAYELVRLGEDGYERAFITAFSRAEAASAPILARALALSGSKAAMDALVQGLSRPITAEVAEDALVSLGRRAAPVLLAAAREGARAPGVYLALGRLGEVKAREIFLERVGSPDAAVSRAARLGLFLLDPAAYADQARVLAEGLRDHARRTFFRAWLAHDPMSAIRHLTDEELASEGFALALASASIRHAPLVDVGVRTWPVLAALARAEEGRRHLLRADFDESLRPAYALAVTAEQDPATRAALLSRLGDGERERVFRALVGREPLPLPVLFRAVERDETFVGAAFLLAKAMAPKAGPTARDRLRAVLRRALRSNDVALRVGACAALSVLADPDARRALVRALEDESRLVRIAAAHALVTLDPGGAKKPVRDAIRVEVDADVREALEAVLIGAPWESPLGLALFGERGTEIPNLVILFASGSVIGY